MRYTKPARIETATPPLAARRDASWLNHPGRGYVYHVATTAMIACCHAERPLAEFTARLAAEVEASSRCRRRGCVERWPS